MRYLLLFCLCLLSTVLPVFAQGDDVTEAPPTLERLVNAVKFEDMDSVKDLLKAAPALLTQVDDDGQTVLHVAARTESDDGRAILDLLLKAGAQVNARAYDGTTPLHGAAADGDAKVVSLLLAKGADVNARDDSGRTPLLTALAETAPDAALIKALLAAKADIALADDQGNSPMHLLAMKSDDGAVAIVTLLLTHKPDLLARDTEGRTPLHLVENVAMAKALLNAGASVTTLDQKGRTPLFNAAKQGQELLSLLLARGGDVRATDLVGDTLMHATVENMTSEAALRANVKFLQSKGLSINAQNAAGMTPLHQIVLGEGMMMAFFGSMPAMANAPTSTGALIALGANPAQANLRGWTPLHLAAMLGNARLVGALLAAKAPVNAADVNGQTPLHLACKRAYFELPELQNLGIMPPPFDTLLERADPVLVDMFGMGFSAFFTNTANPEVISQLLKAGADLRAVNKAGRTPRYLAAEFGYTEAVELLTKAGAPAETLPSARPKREILYANADTSDLERRMEETFNKMAASSELAKLAGYTAAHQAVIHNSPAELRAAIDAKVALDARSTNGETALLLACQDGTSREIVDLLIAKDASLALADQQGRTPLHAAAEAGHADFVQALLAKGADANARDIDGQTPLHLAATPEVADRLLQAGAKLTAIDENGRPPLFGAARAGLPKVVAFLLERGADLKAKDEKGGGVLHAAALSRAEGSAETVTLLLTSGADANAANMQGDTPLHFAAFWGNTGAFTALLDGKAAVNAVGHLGATPLICAIQSDTDARQIDLLPSERKDIKPDAEAKAKLAETLLARGADVNLADGRGFTPLMNATHEGNLELMKLLIAKGAKVDGRDESGNTALHLAAAVAKPEVIDLLLEHGAKLTDRNGEGQTPLHMTAGAGMLFGSMMTAFGMNTDTNSEYLIKKGADINAKDNDGNTLLHLVIGQGSDDETRKRVKMLVSNKADINAKNNDGKTPLISVLDGWSSDETPKMIATLLSLGANPNLADQEGKTPLHYAAGMSDVAAACVKALLGKGAKPGAKDGDGNTPLHLAVMQGNADVAKLLVAVGASAAVKNANGESPLSLARDSGNAALIKALTPPAKPVRKPGPKPKK